MTSNCSCCAFTSSSPFSVNAEWPTPRPLPPLNQSPGPVLNVSSLSPEPAEKKTTQIHSQVTAQLLLHKYHRFILQQRRVRYLFEVRKLDELHGNLGVLQLYGFAHSGLGVCRGQTDQSLERTGCHG